MPLEFQWPFPPTNKVPKKWAIVNKIVVASCGGLSKFWIGNNDLLTIMIYHVVDIINYDMSHDCHSCFCCHFCNHNN